MLASWPLTSGATRISVTRTTPTMGVSALEGHSAYPPAPAATSTMATAMMVAGFLAMRLPPLDEECRDHGEREIDDRQSPQTTPVARHLPQAGTELVDAHYPVDREIRREDIADRLRPFGNRLARPGKSGQEKLWEAGGEEDQGRGFRILEPSARRLAHEARRQDEHRDQREQLQRVAERGKAVDARQHDEIERKRRQIDGQMRDSAAEHR